MRLLKKYKERFRMASCHFLFFVYAFRYHLARTKSSKLHVGCGRNRFDGWINADIEPHAELIVFLQKRLPFRSNSLDRIYSEHVLEHVSYPKGVFFLKEAYRTLKPNGVLRIAIPDLDAIIEGYQNGTWKDSEAMRRPSLAFIKTRAEMLNIVFRWWGHQHLYNKEELNRALREAGFTDVTFHARGKSAFEDLRNLETREESKLIAEAVKI